MDFGYVLRTLRVSANMSLRELSRTINISPTYISMIENGKQPPPSPARIARIEEVLNVPAGCLQAIAQSFRSDINSFMQDIPEALDFLSVARRSSMNSSDFMDLTGFLNTHGWEKLQNMLQVAVAEDADGLRSSRSPFAGTTYIWPFLDEKLVFDMVGVKEKDSFFENAVNRMTGVHNDLDSEVLLGELLERENIATTGIGCGLAVPHAYFDGIDRMIVTFTRIPQGLDFDAIDGEPVYMALVMVGPRSSENLHLRLLARIAKLMNYNSFCEGVLGASSAGEIVAIFKSAEARIP